MRRGEVLGLRWQDVDFQNNIIYVRQSLQEVKGKGITKSNLIKCIVLESNSFQKDALLKKGDLLLNKPQNIFAVRMEEKMLLKHPLTRIITFIIYLFRPCINDFFIEQNN